MSNLKERLLQIEAKKNGTYYKPQKVDPLNEASQLKVIDKNEISSEYSKAKYINWKSNLPDKNLDVHREVCQKTLDYIVNLDKTLSDCFFKNQTLKIYYSSQTVDNFYHQSLDFLLQYFEDCYYHFKKRPMTLMVEEIFITVKNNYTQIEFRCSDSLSETQRWIKSIDNSDSFYLKNKHVSLKSFNKSLLGELNSIQMVVRHQWDQLQPRVTKGVVNNEVTN